MNYKNILVTGGGGFIGSTVSRRLIELGNKVIIIDNLSTGYKSNIPKEAGFIKGDVADRKILNKLSSESIDLIFHFAGQSSGENSFYNTYQDFNDNVTSTIALLDFMLKNNIKNIIYASSVTVYGNCSIYPFKEDYAKIEEVNSFYALGKLTSENYLKLFSENFSINAISLRFFNVYGPGQNMKNLNQGMVSIYLEMIKNNDTEIYVKGSLDRFRDLIHIDDVSDLCVMLSNKSFKGFNEYNVGSGEKTKVRTMLKYIFTIIKKNLNIVVEKSTPGDFNGSLADISKISKFVKFKPKINSENGIKSFADFYLKT